MATIQGPAADDDDGDDDKDACAREEKTNVSRMALFDRDDGPGRCATVVAEVRKSCSQKPV